MGFQFEVPKDTICVEKRHASPQVHPCTRRASRSKTPNKLTEQKEFWDLKELKEMDSCLHSPAICLFFQDSGACLFGCARLSLSGSCWGHPRPPLSGIDVPWVSLPGPTDVPWCPGWHQSRAPTLVWLLECCLVNVSCVHLHTSSTRFHPSLHRE